MAHKPFEVGDFLQRQGPKAITLLRLGISFLALCHLALPATRPVKLSVHTAHAFRCHKVPGLTKPNRSRTFGGLTTARCFSAKKALRNAHVTSHDNAVHSGVLCQQSQHVPHRFRIHIHRCKILRIARPRILIVATDNNS